MMGLMLYKGSGEGGTSCTTIHMNDSFFVSEYDYNVLTLGGSNENFGFSGGIAQDAIVVSPTSLDDSFDGSGRKSGTTTIASSDFYVEFPQIQKSFETKYLKGEKKEGLQSSPILPLQQFNQDYIVLLQINNVIIDPSILCMSLPSNNSNNNYINSNRSNHCKSQQCLFLQGHSNTPSSDVLQKLLEDQIFHPGKNSIRYILAKIKKSKDSTCMVESDGNIETKKMTEHEKSIASNSRNYSSISKPIMESYEPIDTVEAYVYLWSVNDCVIVIDIDGTITKSDVKGVISTVIREDYKHVHDGICTFFSNLVQGQEQEQQNMKKELQHVVMMEEKQEGEVGQQLSISENGKKYEARSTDGNVRVVYLSARPLKFMESTRKFITQLSQSSEDIPKNSSKAMKTIQSCFCNDFTEQVHDEDDEYDFCNDIQEVVNNGEVQNNIESEIHDKVNPMLKGGKSLGKHLPEGPIFLHPGTLSSVLMSELVKKDIYEYKSETLIRKVVTPFIAAGKGFNPTSNEKKRPTSLSSVTATFDSSHIFVAGFGNTEKDAKAYISAGMKKEHVYIINKNSEVVNGEIDLLSSVTASKKLLKATYDIPEKVVDQKQETIDSSSTNTISMKQSYNGYGDPDLTQALRNRIATLVTKQGS